MTKTLSLFMVITATASLYSMEQPFTYALNTLPQEVQNIVVEYLVQGTSSDSIIKAIQTTSCTCLNLHATIYTFYGIGHSPLIKTNDTHDPHDKFHKFVHVLANKFNTGTEEIVKEVKAPIFQRYFDLLEKFNKVIFTLHNPDVNNQIKELIEQGIDINGSSGIGRVTLLMKAIRVIDITTDIDTITLLLSHGPNPKNGFATTMIRSLMSVSDLEKRNQITQLLEDAQKKLQSTEK